MSYTPRLGRGSKRCSICYRQMAVIGWCDECRRSYDRCSRGDDTVLAVVLWAARRARRFALKEKARKP